MESGKAHKSNSMEDLHRSRNQFAHLANAGESLKFTLWAFDDNRDDKNRSEVVYNMNQVKQTCKTSDKAWDSFISQKVQPLGLTPQSKNVWEKRDGKWHHVSSFDELESGKNYLVAETMFKPKDFETHRLPHGMPKH